MKAFEIITDRILSALDAGTIPWRKPWTCGGAPRNLVTGMLPPVMLGPTHRRISDPLTVF